MAALFPALLCGQQPVAQGDQNQPDPGGRVPVHGVVLNAASGDPLPRALVRLTGSGDTGTLTDGDGRFEIPDLPVGPQQFEIVKPGYLDEIAEASAAAGGDARDFAHTVVVAAEMPDVTFRMAPANAIHGQVQLSTGDSAEGIEIVLLKQIVESGRLTWQAAATTRANADGAYRFGGLADGAYAVYNSPALDSESSFQPVDPVGRERSGYASQFYPQARDLAGAAKLQLKGGEQAEANLALTLEAFHAVTAIALLSGERVGQESTPDRRGATVSAVVMDSQGHQLPYVAQYDGSAHAVRAMLPDGNYSIGLTAGRPTLAARRGLIARPSRDDGPYTGTVEFSVAGHAVMNLRVPLTLAPRSLVQVNLTRTTANTTGGTAIIEGGDSIFLTMSQTGGWIGDGMISTFATGGYAGPLNTSFASPGAYWIHTNLADKHVCEASLTAGGTSLAREPLTLGLSSSPTPLALNLRDDCAKLTLTLPASAAGSGVGEEPFYTIYVVPDFDSTEDVVTQTLRPSTGGKATLEGLTPGSYHIYVFAKPVALAYREHAVLDALPSGQPVNLTPGQAASLTLEVPKS